MSAEQIIGRAENGQSPSIKKRIARVVSSVIGWENTFRLYEIGQWIPRPSIGLLVRGGGVVTLAGGGIAIENFSGRTALVEAAGNANAGCVDEKGSKIGTFHISGMQVEFLDLVGREGIFDKGKNSPLDPWLERPALGGSIKVYPPERKKGETIDEKGEKIVMIDDKVKHVGYSSFTQTEPRIPNVKLPHSGRKVAWAHVEWTAPYNARKTIKSDKGDKTVCAFEGWIVSTLHEKNLVPLHIAGGGILPYWFGRERKDLEGFMADAYKGGLGRDLAPSPEAVREAYKIFKQKQAGEGKDADSSPQPPANGQPAEGGRENPPPPAQTELEKLLASIQDEGKREVVRKNIVEKGNPLEDPYRYEVRIWGFLKRIIDRKW